MYTEESGIKLLYCIVLYCIVLYCIVLYCIVLYCIVLYCIVLYCIVLKSQQNVPRIVFMQISASIIEFIFTISQPILQITDKICYEGQRP